MVDDGYGRRWIIDKAQDIVASYDEGITIRQLHYRLVTIGMTNDDNHYKRVVKAMAVARWDNILDMDSFVDRERSMYGETAATEKDLRCMENYNLERWSNQNNYIEVWIEKKALQGVFENTCLFKGVGLAPCKGYPSLTFLNEAAHRFRKAIDDGKEITILYFGDYDPSGEDIPRSIKENLERMGITLNMVRKALNPEQIAKYGLPGKPPKKTDSRTKNWDGQSVVELDAIDPKTLKEMAEAAIAEYFDKDLYLELELKAREERKKYRIALKDYVDSLAEDQDDDEDEEA